MMVRFFLKINYNVEKILKVAFFQKVRCIFQISKKKKLFQITILNSKQQIQI